MKKGWEPTRIGELLTIQNGFAFDSKSFSASKGVPLIRIRDLKNGQSTETKYYGAFDRRYEVKSGDLLIGMDGEFGCYEWQGGKALLNQRVCRLQGFSGKLQPKFLFYGINKYLKEIEEATTYTTVKHLSSKQIANIEIPLPSLSEQQRIVAILDGAFAGLATATAHAEKNLKNARELFDSYLNSIFANGEGDWPNTPLGQVCNFVRGPFGGSLKKSIFVEHGFAVYEQQHAIYDQFDEIRYFVNNAKFDEMRRFELKSGDLIMSCSGTMGRVAIAPPRIKPGIINQALLKLTPNEKIKASFLKYWMESGNFQQALKSYSGGAAIQNVASVKILKEISIPLPSVDVQAKLVSQLDFLGSERQSLEDNYNRKLDDLAKLKQSILQKAFSGELTAPPSQAIKEAAE